MNRFPSLHAVALVATLIATRPAHATECFSMFDAKNALVYQSTTTPIDLSGSISDQMARRFPARFLVITDVGTCAEAGAGSGAAMPNAGHGGSDGPAAYGANATSPAPVNAPPDTAVPVRRVSRAASRR